MTGFKISSLTVRPSERIGSRVLCERTTINSCWSGPLFETLRRRLPLDTCFGAVMWKSRSVTLIVAAGPDAAAECSTYQAPPRHTLESRANVNRRDTYRICAMSAPRAKSLDQELHRAAISARRSGCTGRLGSSVRNLVRALTRLMSLSEGAAIRSYVASASRSQAVSACSDGRAAVAG